MAVIDYNGSHLDVFESSCVKPSFRKMEYVDVQINPEVMVHDFAKATAYECKRTNPDLYKEEPISEQEMYAYSVFLIAERINCVNNCCVNWRLLKRCVMPTFLEYTLTTIGEVRDLDHGLTFKPCMSIKPELHLSEDNKREYTITDALEFSRKLSMYEDRIHLVFDAMPRKPEGDADVMSMAVVDDYVCGVHKTQNVPKEYIVAFLHATLKREQAFKVLYRVRYDDISIIQNALWSERYLYGRHRST